MYRREPFAFHPDSVKKSPALTPATAFAAQN
jgi:hypothetical protein